MITTDLPLEDSDYFVRVFSFGVPIPAFIRLNNDASYSLYLNADYDFEHWLDSYEHELQHMAADDLYSDRDVMEIEFGRGA